MKSKLRAAAVALGTTLAGATAACGGDDGGMGGMGGSGGVGGDTVSTATSTSTGTGSEMCDVDLTQLDGVSKVHIECQFGTTPMPQQIGADGSWTVQCVPADPAKELQTPYLHITSEVTAMDKKDRTGMLMQCSAAGVDVDGTEAALTEADFGPSTEAPANSAWMQVAPSNNWVIAQCSVGNPVSVTAPTRCHSF